MNKELIEQSDAIEVLIRHDLLQNLDSDRKRILVQMTFISAVNKQIQTYNNAVITACSHCNNRIPGANRKNILLKLSSVWRQKRLKILANPYQAKDTVLTRDGKAFFIQVNISLTMENIKPGSG
jgi:hypothetical protein